ncbi:DivIVA domain-containing protein [Aerococcaceae bacterium zg-ZUI334]|uniref:DivIVA domain-containing protein n=1 Tax=Aerococcaceae bacterium zg-252 TaxID=2796928 RepID=UPI001B97727A|nr:DivIVA domain-containing protein [Aerococcaceae bacterium zg-ZUI334]
MALTPSEILHKEFSSKFRGYDPDEVNDFLDAIVAEFEKLTLSNKELTSKMSAMQDKLNYFQQLQDSLNNSIVIAQEAADRLKQNARKEAELILFEAEREADRLIMEATHRSESIISETEQLQSYGKEFREKLTNMVEAQLALINNTEYQPLFEAAPVLNSLNSVKATGSINERVDVLEQELAEEFQSTPVLEEMTFPTVESQPAQEEMIFPTVDSFDDFGTPDDLEVDESFDIEALMAKNEGPAIPKSVVGRTIRIDLPE